MLNRIFSSILEDGVFSGLDFLLSIGTALICGLFIACLFMIKNKCSRSLAATLVLLPGIVAVVIILVNGNVGYGVAVAGAFSLVRFRSAPGRGQDISTIFLAMSVGLACGMGYLGVAAAITLIISFVSLILNISGFGDRSRAERELKIKVPEDLDFEGRFEEIFPRFLSGFELESVKTANMGTVYVLQYRVSLLPGTAVKEMIDEIRKHNGNLEVNLSRPEIATDEL